MNNNSFHLTPEGLNQLKAELINLLEEKLPNARERVRVARDQGDLSENSEYHAAREDLSFLQGRADELQELIGRAKIVKKTNKQTIGLGSKVTVKTHTGQDHVFHIVGKYEANPAEKKISDESPLGQALLGKKVGQKIEYQAPIGKIIYTIHKIH